MEVIDFSIQSTSMDTHNLFHCFSVVVSGEASESSPVAVDRARLLNAFWYILRQKLIVQYRRQHTHTIFLHIQNRNLSTGRKTDMTAVVGHFLARDSIYAIARYMSSPVRLSLCPSHGWISQRRLKLGSRNLHHRVAP